MSGEARRGHLLTSPVILQSGKPFLGICLGLQLMFEGSTESGGVEGLGIVPGAVAEFDRSKGLPVPHIGWNSLQERSAAHAQAVSTSIFGLDCNRFWAVGRIQGCWQRTKASGSILSTPTERYPLNRTRTGSLLSRTMARPS